MRVSQLENLDGKVVPEIAVVMTLKEGQELVKLCEAIVNQTKVNKGTKIYKMAEAISENLPCM